MFISVDLPAPFSPRSACTSPSMRSKLTSSFATIPGKRFVMLRISSTWARADIRAIIWFRRAAHTRSTRADPTRMAGGVRLVGGRRVRRTR